MKNIIIWIYSCLLFTLTCLQVHGIYIFAKNDYDMKNASFKITIIKEMLEKQLYMSIVKNKC